MFNFLRRTQPPPVQQPLPKPIQEPHPSPSLAHSSSSIDGWVSLPPAPLPTAPKTNQLNAVASTFVPRKVTLKNQDGVELDLRNFKNVPKATTQSVSTPSTPTPHVQGKPRTRSRRGAGIRIESEDQWNRRRAELQTKREETEGGFSTSLSSARYIMDLSTVQYPEGVRSFQPGLNENAQEGKFRFDRDFLLQFMSVCKGKPATLAPDLGVYGLEPVSKASSSVTRGSSSKLPMVEVSEDDVEEIQSDPDSYNIERDVLCLLNQLRVPVNDINSVSDQMLALLWANKSEEKKTLEQIIKPIVGKAKANLAWAQTGARLCWSITERMTPIDQGGTIRVIQGNTVVGEQLFRQLLHERCKKEFNSLWVAGRKRDDSRSSGGVRRSQPPKITGLGLIKFMSELFKLQMLTEGVMYEYVEMLLGNVDDPKEGQAESIDLLLTTVGSLLDKPESRIYLDDCFSRLRELAESPNIAPRMRFMLRDLIELRNRKWLARPAFVASNEIYVAAGDLSSFGKISKAQPLSFGPANVFAGKKGPGNKRESNLRTSTSSNVSSMLPSQAAAPGKAVNPTQRRRLVLTPR